MNLKILIRKREKCYIHQSSLNVIYSYILSVILLNRFIISIISFRRLYLDDNSPFACTLNDQFLPTFNTYKKYELATKERTNIGFSFNLIKSLFLSLLFPRIVIEDFRDSSYLTADEASLVKKRVK